MHNKEIMPLLYFHWGVIYFKVKMQDITINEEKKNSGLGSSEKYDFVGFQKVQNLIS